MCPFPESEGSDGVRQGGKLVPSGKGGIDDMIDAVEDGVGQPLGTQELPDIFDRVQSGRAGQQEDWADIAGQLQLVGGMPQGLRPRFNKRAEELCISDVVLYELLYSAERSSDPVRIRCEVEHFAARLAVLPFGLPIRQILGLLLKGMAVS